jgi:iron complex transport system ATP-binding protein
MPYGNGNLINLEILKDVDKPIYFIEKNGQYDYTEGKATKIIDELKKKNNFYVIDHYEKFLSNFNLESKR